jgi:SAM-dependent methyltransferase
VKDDTTFWKDLILEASRLDYGEPVPNVDDQFLKVWSSHYACIAAMASPRSRFLEIGAGYGVLAAGLGELAGGPVWATEHPSRSYLFRPRYRAFLEGRGVLLVAHDLREGLPFRPGIFAQVYACDVIEHLFPEAALSLLGEITRVLAPGGELILSTPNLNRLANWVRLLRGHSVNPPPEIQRIGDTFGHIREFAPKEIALLLERRGFRTVRQTFGLNPYFTVEAFGGYNIFSPRAAKIVNRLTALVSRLLPAAADEMYVLARRL